ncbi:nucleotide sugar dehydrogenase [Verrucomicrobiales bacterium]|nr:nucleotide sugar dehydrogenase [Verrucomicrobiales bacterium]
MSDFVEKINNRKITIGIIGLGYVGLPLVINFAEKKFKVVGFDIDITKIKTLSDGQSYIDHIPSEPINEFISDGSFVPTNDFSKISKIDVIIICVPTPLDRHLDPDLSYVLNTLDQIIPFLNNGQIISLESTTYPGTTTEVLQPRIESKGFVLGQDLYLVYSPEREDPGNQTFTGTAIPKVLGGVTAECLEYGSLIYSAIYPVVVKVSSTAVAEFTKLLENIYRSVNIGLVNEMKIIASKMGVDIWEVIEAAKTKPFGFNAFYPGPGLGGHCIPIDPFYLTWKAKEYGVNTRFIELAGEINRSMPDYVVNLVIEALNKKKRSVNGSKILIIGLAYKSNVDDMRESPSFMLMDSLQSQGAELSYYDPHIPEIPITREHGEWTGLLSIEWSEANISNQDCTIIATKHDTVNFEDLASWSDCIVDTRNAMNGIMTTKGQVIKA